MYPDIEYQIALEHHRDLRETSKLLPQYNKHEMLIMRFSIIIRLLLMVIWLA